MYTLTIPKDLQPCNQCVLRLQRSAQEWGSYKFWSCADVNVVQSSGMYSTGKKLFRIVFGKLVLKVVIILE